MTHPGLPAGGASCSPGGAIRDPAILPTEGFYYSSGGLLVTIVYRCRLPSVPDHRKALTSYETPSKPLLLNCCYVVQMFCSLSHVVVWATRTYTHEASGLAFERTITLWFIFHYFINAAKNEFDPWYSTI